MTDIYEKIAKKCNINKVMAKAVLRATFEAVKEQLAEDGSVKIYQFGTFEIKSREARQGFNPKTGEILKIAAKRYPTFKSSQTFKDYIMK